MIFKNLYSLVFLICLYGCFGNSNSQVNKPFEKKFRLHSYNSSQQYGIDIENGPRQGMQYIDSTGTEYNYRYNTITIWNDSTVAIQLEIDSPGKEIKLKDSIKSKFFLLPRHLTPSEQHFDTGGISKELKKFLDFETDNHLHLSKILNPQEKCVMTFGVLTNIKYPDPTTPYETALLTSYESSSTISLKLKINDSLIIPCGKFSYMKQ